MWQRVSGNLVVLLLILSVTTYSQQQMPRIAQKSPHLPRYSPDFSEKTFGFSFKKEIREGKKIQSITTPVMGISPGFYAAHLGFFCKKELQLEKTTLIPLRFRLGSLEYVNKIEGKK
jgi:hypothetical protein